MIFNLFDLGDSIIKTVIREACEKLMQQTDEVRIKAYYCIHKELMKTDVKMAKELEKHKSHLLISTKNDKGELK